MKKLFCLFALAILALPYINAQTTDNLVRKPKIYNFEFPNRSQALRNIPFEFKAPAFSNPLDQYSLKTPQDSGLLALNQPHIERAPEDNMPIVNLGNNSLIRYFKPDPDKQYFLRIYDPHKVRPLILNSEK